MKTALLALLLAGCVDEGATLAEACGPRPLQPGMVAAFDHDTVTMRRRVYLDQSAWAEDMTAWAQCVEEVSQ